MQSLLNARAAGFVYGGATNLGYFFFVTGCRILQIKELLIVTALCIMPCHFQSPFSIFSPQYL